MNDRLNVRICQFLAAQFAKSSKKLIKALQCFSLEQALSQKCYYWISRQSGSAGEIVRNLFDEYLGVIEEGIFEDIQRELAVFVAMYVYKGRRSDLQGIDLEFDKDNVRYIVSIKSGPHWGNSSQIKKLENDFKLAMKVLHTSHNEVKVEAINGCCYGRTFSDKGFYKKICGQKFWELVSGRENLYLEIIKPLATDAKKRTEEFEKEYSAKLNLFIKDFIRDYCLADGSVNWEKIVKLNSGAKK